jgi:SAM-dependent methyltransferase
MTSEIIKLDVDRLRRFASVGVCPVCGHEFTSGPTREQGLRCTSCSRPIAVEAGVVLALADSGGDGCPTLSGGQSARAESLEGWAAGIASDMDGKARTYATKYECRTRASAGFLTRRELALHFAGSDPGRVLEAGCGPGVTSPELSTRGVETHGVDLSVGQLRAAAVKDPRTLYVQGDLQNLPYRATAFDTIMLLGVFEYVNDPRRVIRELARVMADDGRVVLTVPNAFGLLRLWTEWAYLPASRVIKKILGRPVPTYSRRLYSQRRLATLLAHDGMEVERTRYFDVMLAGPPLDRMLSRRPSRLITFLEHHLDGPLRVCLANQIIVSAVKRTVRPHPFEAKS